MAKKIRFPLEMEQGVEVRSLEELREYFSLARVLVYVSNGKIVTWLRDRYADEIADAIEELDINDSQLALKLCEIFDIEYNEDIVVNLEKAEERNRKLILLKEYTTEKRFLDVIDIVAFTQDDIYDLLDEEETTIYLCGEKFAIPLSQKGMTYIGINTPIVVIESKEEVNWEQKEITLSNIRYDNKYQKIIETANTKKQELMLIPDVSMINELVDGLKGKRRKVNSYIEEYSKDSYLNFMLSTNDKEAAEHCYNIIKNKINGINYDINRDTLNIRNFLENSRLIGFATNYIEKL